MVHCSLCVSFSPETRIHQFRLTLERISGSQLTQNQKTRFRKKRSDAITDDGRRCQLFLLFVSWSFGCKFPETCETLSLFRLLEQDCKKYPVSLCMFHFSKIYLFGANEKFTRIKRNTGFRLADDQGRLSRESRSRNED